MVKSRRSSRVGASYARRKRQARSARWLPWALGAVVVLIIVAAIGPRLVASAISGSGPRDQEVMSNVSGYSYDAGPTDYTYPDPAGLGAGRKWLPALGSEDAPVTVIQVSDIFCSHCRDFNLKSLPGILEDYVATGKVRYIDHYFGFASSVQQGAVLAEMCAAEQGRYFVFKHALYQSVAVGDFDIARAGRIAHLDMKAFDTCRDEQRYNAAVQEMAFVDNMGVTATPAFFVNGELISGNLPDVIRQKIDAALEANTP